MARTTARAPHHIGGALFVLLLLFAPLPGEPQQAREIPRIGVLWGYSRSDVSGFGEAFRGGLRELGYVEGQNIALEERWSEGSPDRLPSLAGELVRLNVDIIVAASTPAARAAQRATKTIPIVLTLITDPVESGLVASLARPGGNVTGLSMMNPEVSGKRLELLKEAVPKVSRLAVLRTPSTPAYSQQLGGTEAAARALGLHLQIVQVLGSAGLDSAFATVTRDRVGALLPLPDPFFRNHLRRVLELVAKSRLPAIYVSREFVEAGGLMSYGPSVPAMHRQAAALVDKILKGAKPAELPIEQPAKLEFVINLKTARALGLTIPSSLLLRADQVIE